MAIPFKVVDLFAGAGGLTLGFKKAGFAPILAVESEPDFADTYRENFGDHVLPCRIENFIDAGIPVKANVVIGGPPCQGFSNLTGNRRNDPRRAMWKHFMKVVKSTECKVFLIENVPNLLTSSEGDDIIKHARNLGFKVDSGILNAAHFGVPQNRKRAFIVGSLLGPIKLPDPDPKTKLTSVRMAFKGIGRYKTRDVPDRRPLQGCDLHIGRNPTKMSLARYEAIEEGGNRFQLPPELTPPCWKRKVSGGTDLFGRLVWKYPAHCTIRTEFYKPEKGRYLHPKENRPITHWEAARLQSFPDTFKWHGTKIRIAIQIGNAVPPDLAKSIADSIMEHLKSYPVKRVRKLSDVEIQKLKSSCGDSGGETKAKAVR